LVNQFNKQWKRRFYRKIRYACVYDGDKFVVIAPLRIKRLIKKKGIVKEIELLGSDSFSDYVNLIYAEAENEHFECLMNGLASNWKGYALNWTSIPKESAFGAYIRGRFGENVQDWYKTVLIPLDRFENFDDYFKSLSKSTRQNYRTACNRMNRDGVSFRWKIYDGIIEKSLIDTLLEINLERTIEKNQSEFSTKRAIRKESRELKYYSIVRSMMSEMKSCWTLVVYINDKEAGFLTGAKSGRIIYVVMNKVKPEYEFYSPMIAAIVQLAEKLYGSREIEILDFGRGTEDYKYKLGGVDTDLVSLVTKTSDIKR
jgi:hypothetical protein